MDSKHRTHAAVVRRLDRIAAAPERIATAMESRPTSAINIEMGEHSQIGENIENDNHSTLLGDTQHIERIKEAFNTNHTEAIKNLTSALLTKHNTPPTD